MKPALPRSSIKADETVVFFPTIGEPQQDGWKLRLRGWIYEFEQNRVLVGSVRRALGIESEEMAVDDYARFVERVRMFFVDNERWKRVPVLLAGQPVVLRRSRSNGHLDGELILSAEAVRDLASLPGSDRKVLPFQALTREGDGRIFSGEVHLLEEQGISVVSDIDDTIKISEVLDRKALLANTFWKPFHPVPGMSELYQTWERELGLQFHYLSGSPWQLFTALRQFLKEDGFPAGTFHLRNFRWTDRDFFSLFRAPRIHKVGVLAPLFRAFPKRRFILVGDSGEMDPEIYGEVARLFPSQVMRIFIRQVPEQEQSKARYAAAFRDVPPTLWQLFREPEELSGHTFG